MTPQRTLAISLMLALCSSGAMAQDWQKEISLALGSKDLRDKGWQPHDEQDAIGVLMDFRKQEWPVSLTLDLFGAGKEVKQTGSRYEATTGEAHLGLRRRLLGYEADFSPYLGGGLALMTAEEKISSGTNLIRSDVRKTGYWVGAGLDYRLTSRLSLGLDWRYSSADARMLQKERDLGGEMFSVRLGYRW